MNTNRKAKKILKQFGKEAYRTRIQYINSFADEETSFIGRISYRHMMKRCALVVLILTLSFALLLVTASAFGIHILHFSFFEKTDHTEIASNVTESSSEDDCEFYEPGYIPSGYKLIAEEPFGDIELEYIYKNEEEEYLYIDQHLADGFLSNINNENCEISTTVIDDKEVRIYDYGERKTCLLQYNSTFILIKGILPAIEFKKIIKEIH